MFDIDKELENFNSSVEAIKTKSFDSFTEMELEYCNLINSGNKIRTYVIQNPSVCSEDTLKVLTNQSNDISLLEDKFKCLLNVMYLMNRLFNEYGNYVLKLKQEGKWEDAMNVYEQMFRFTQNYHFKQEIANIKYQIFNQIEESFEIYKNIEPHLSNDKDFWWQFSDIYKAKNDIYNQVLCVQKALELEEEPEND